MRKLKNDAQVYVHFAIKPIKKEVQWDNAIVWWVKIPPIKYVLETNMAYFTSYGLMFQLVYTTLFLGLIFRQHSYHYMAHFWVGPI